MDAAGLAVDSCITLVRFAREKYKTHQADTETCRKFYATMGEVEAYTVYIKTQLRAADGLSAPLQLLVQKVNDLTAIFREVEKYTNTKWAKKSEEKKKKRSDSLVKFNTRIKAAFDELLRHVKLYKLCRGLDQNDVSTLPACAGITTTVDFAAAPAAAGGLSGRQGSSDATGVASRTVASRVPAVVVQPRQPALGGPPSRHEEKPRSREDAVFEQCSADELLLAGRDLILSHIDRLIEVKKKVKEETNKNLPMLESSLGAWERNGQHEQANQFRQAIKQKRSAIADMRRVVTREYVALSFILERCKLLEALIPPAHLIRRSRCGPGEPGLVVSEECKVMELRRLVLQREMKAKAAVGAAGRADGSPVATTMTPAELRMAIGALSENVGMLLLRQADAGAGSGGPGEDDV